MNNKPEFDYFYGTEAEQFTFYRIPKMLFIDKRFKKISAEAKLIYGLMLDRMGLSMKNNWLDNKNRVYIYFTIEDAIELLGYGRSKVIKLFAELDKQTGAGLIERKKQGQGKPSIIYIKSFASVVDYTNTSFDEKSEIQTSKIPQYESNDETSDLDTNNLYENTHVAQNIELMDSGFDYNMPDDNNVIYMQENVQSQKSEIQISRSLNFKLQEVLKTDSNKNNINKTNISDIKSINPSKSSFTQNQFVNDGLIERMPNEDLEELVLADLYNQQTLPYEYTQDERKMRIAIYEFTEYNHFQNQAKYNSKNEFEFSVLRLFCEALIEMLTTKQLMNLRGASITYAKVHERLIPHLDFKSNTYGSLQDLKEVAIGDFVEACGKTKIQNYLAYMKSCIWTAMQVGDISAQMLIRQC